MLSTHPSPESTESSPSKTDLNNSETSLAENLQSDAVSNSVIIFKKFIFKAPGEHRDSAKNESFFAP